MSKFERGDIAKMQEFIRYKDEAKKEFSAIRSEFERINTTLLKEWDGHGASAYYSLSKHITEKVGGISDTLDIIVDELLSDLTKNYEEMDKALDEYNRKAMEPPEDAEEKGCS